LRLVILNIIDHKKILNNWRDGVNFLKPELTSEEIYNFYGITKDNLFETLVNENGNTMTFNSKEFCITIAKKLNMFQTSLQNFKNEDLDRVSELLKDNIFWQGCRPFYKFESDTWEIAVDESVRDPFTFLKKNKVTK